jgi:hypothetical protein
LQHRYNPVKIRFFHHLIDIIYKKLQFFIKKAKYE